jgi:hypothetical protein
MYAIWNIGFFYILAACTLGESAQIAINDGIALKLINNPALLTISVMSAPHQFLRNFLEFIMESIGLRDATDFNDLLKSFVLSGAGSFEKSFLLFLMGYGVVISPMVYLFVLNKGDSKKKFEDACNKLFRIMPPKGKSFMTSLTMIVVLVVIIPLLTYAVLNVALF